MIRFFMRSVQKTTQMEYASAVWDPYHNSLIQQLQKVQRRAARWIFNDYTVDSVQSQQC